MFQIGAWAQSPRYDETLMLPRGVGRIRFGAPVHVAARVEAVARRALFETSTSDAALLAKDGSTLATFAGVQLRAVPSLTGLPWDPKQWMLRDEWVEIPCPEPKSRGEVTVGLLCGRSDAGDRVAARLVKEGVAVARLAHGDEVDGWLRKAKAERARAVVADLRCLDAGERDESSLPETVADLSWRAVELLQAVSAASGRVELVFATDASRGPAFAALLGLVRVSEQEHADLPVRLVQASGADRDDAVATEILADDGEREVTWTSAVRRALRIRRLFEGDVPAPGAAGREGGPRTVTIDRAGRLAVRSAPRRSLEPDQVRVDVKYASLNFKDVLKVAGLYPTEAGDADAFRIGDECSGVVREVGPAVAGVAVGDEVIVRHPGGCISTELRVGRRNVFRRPSTVALADAATVPVVFTTAWYALKTLGRLSKGERILVHSAAGGVGLAAIQIARSCGAEIFATTGSREKRELLAGLGIEHVFSSRDLSFADDVLAATGGEGIDLVLNSLAGPSMVQSLPLLREFGRFVELGKRDLYGNTPIGLFPMRKNVSYHAVDLARLWATKPEQAAAVFAEVLAAFESGGLTPLPKTVFPFSDVGAAFDHLRQGTHIGKTVIDCSATAGIALPDVTDLGPRYRDLVRSDGCYVVTGGFGALGRVVLTWLADVGAKDIAVVSRGGPADPEARALVEDLKRRGVIVRSLLGSVEDATFLERELARLRASCAIRGVIHLAGVLKDAPIRRIQERDLRAVLAPKVSGAWNLHTLTARDSLDLFVLFSSAAVTFGAAGQGSYAVANSFLDWLAGYRQALGLPAQSIGWGVFLGGGMMTHEIIEARRRIGVAGMNAEEVRILLGDRVPAGPAHVTVSVIDFAKRMRDIVPRRFEQFRVTTGESSEMQLSARIRSATPDEAVAMLEGYLREAIGAIRGVPPDTLGPADPLGSIGFDSLAVMSLASRVLYDVGVKLALFEISRDATVNAIAKRIVERAGTSAPARAETVADHAAARASGALQPSFAQERLWFIDRLQGGSAAYNIPTILRVSGELDVASLRRAIGALCARHDVLRTAFREVDGRPVPVVAESVDVALSLADASSEDEALGRAKRSASVPFDLATGPLFRVDLCRLSPSDHVLGMAFHHTIVDGWSLEVLVHDLVHLYDAVATNSTPALPPLSTSYTDFAAWQRDRVASADGAAQLEFWKANLAGAPPFLDLPADFSRGKAQAHRGEVALRTIDPALAGRLAALGQREDATLFMILLSAWATLLGRHAGQEDVVVGIPLAQRTRSVELERIVGMFMNTLPVRVRLAQPSFIELLRSVRTAALGAFSNQDVPFEAIVDAIKPPRDLNRTPIFQVMMNVLNFPRLDWSGQRLSARRSTGANPLDIGFSLAELELYAYEKSNAIALTLMYDATLFAPSRMRELLAQLVSLLDAVAADPHLRPHEHSLVTSEAREVLPDATIPLHARAHTAVPARFQETVRARPDARAVVDPKRSWTYGELGARANQLAHWLKERGVHSGSVVAIHADRNALTVWATLAVLQAGAAFVLLDAEYPSARLVDQLERATPNAWIGAVESRPMPPELEAAAAGIETRIDLAAGAAPWSSQPSTPLERSFDPDARAYVVFTSGTTGGPKAIVGSHGPLAHFVDWHSRIHELGPADRFSALSGIGHDPFLRDVLVPLCIGGCVCLPPSELRKEPTALAAWMETERITVCDATPSLGDVIALSRGSLGALRWVFFGGEPLPAQLVESLRAIAPNARFVNFYGTTETPQAMGFQTVQSPSVPGTVPVGRGIEGVQLLVVTDAGVLAGIGEEGEIWVRTPHLALGYLDGEPRGFGANPFGTDPADRVYRTGDRGRYRPDGAVQIAGRRDDQVKVRGFRVELTEVEAMLRQQPSVEQAAVVLDENRRALVGYVVGAAEPKALVASLRRSLPDYMVPAAVVKLPSLPLTPNGKLDRGALPAPPERRADEPSPEQTVEDSVTASVASVWREVLKVDEVGRHDNFFDLGGHSLLATMIVSRLYDVFAVAVPVRAVFEAPTVAELAEHVSALVLDTLSEDAGGKGPSSGS